MKLSAFALFKSPCHVFFFWFRTKFPVLGLWTNPQYMKGRLESPNESSIPYSPSVIPYDSLVHSPTNQPTNPRTSHPTPKGPHNLSPSRQAIRRAVTWHLGLGGLPKVTDPVSGASIPEAFAGQIWTNPRIRGGESTGYLGRCEDVGENPRDTWGDVFRCWG